MDRILIGMVGAVYLITIMPIFTIIISNVTGEEVDPAGDTRHTGDLIYADYGSTPIIDGLISPGEWDDANYIQFGDNLHDNTVYFKHNGQRLYIGFDMIDPIFYYMEETAIGLDTDHDGEASSVDYILEADRSGLNHHTRMGPDYGIMEENPDGWDASESNKSNGWQIEYYITFELIYLTPGPDITLGIAFRVSGGMLTPYYWPTGSYEYDPSSYADMSSTNNWGTGNVNNQPPTAIANAIPISGEAPLEVQFYGSGDDYDGSIISYYWDFADGTFSSEQNPIHTFNDPGNYDSILTVKDDYNAIGTDSISITVKESTQNRDGNGNNNDGDSSSSGEEKEKGFIPGFEFLYVLLGILIIIVISRKRLGRNLGN